ncbi:MAG: hypothetical protein AB1758_01025 [Candidatus Eremiobacterota bacterium]
MGVLKVLVALFLLLSPAALAEGLASCCSDPAACCCAPENLCCQLPPAPDFPLSIPSQPCPDGSRHPWSHQLLPLPPRSLVPHLPRVCRAPLEQASLSPLVLSLPPPA